MPLILGTNSIKDTGYDVANSCRFDDGDDARISKTFSSAGNSDTWTMSVWVKRSTLGANSSIFTCNGLGALAQKGTIRFDSSDKISAYVLFAGGAWHYITSNAVYRDTSAWMHIVVRCDTTQSTDTDRLRLYVNGTLQTLSGSTYPDQNEDTFFNEAEEHQVASLIDETEDFDGYMAEFCWIDGSSLAPTSFGEFDEDSGIWKPIDVSGLTFGTNGVYLDFEDSSDLGKDASGNSDWTATNLSAIDQSTDTCTNNFATWNPLNVNDNMGSFVNGNLEYETSVSSFRTAFATFGASQGKWYFECKRITGTSFAIGIISLDYKNRTKNVSYIGGAGDATNNIGYMKDGNTAIGGSETSGYASYGNGDTVMVAMDIDNGKVYFGVNGTWGNSGDPTSGATGTGAISFTPSGETWTFGVSVYNSHWEANFGSPMYAISSGNTDGNGYGNFEYSVPSGYYSLCTKNLAEYG